MPACLPASASATAATAARVCFHHHWSSSPNERGGFFQDECLGRNGGCSLLLQLLLWDCDKVSIITLAYSCGSESCGDTVACAAEQLCAVTLTSFELHQSTVMHHVCVGQINCTQSLLDWLINRCQVSSLEGGGGRGSCVYAHLLCSLGASVDTS